MLSIQIFSQLDKVRWHIAEKTFGNDHSTLIGLLVDWWISMSPKTHFALEGGPGIGAGPQEHRGQCDALFCSDGKPIGVLEVEGTRYQYTIDKIRRFLTTTDDDYRDIEFGMLLLYAYEPTGTGNSRHFGSPDNDESFEQIKTITGACPGKAIIVLLLEKVYIRQNTGIRSKNEYYFGEPSKVSGLLFVGGLCSQRRVLIGAK